MTSEEFQQEILRNLPYVPNDQQLLVIGALSRFCSPKAPEDAVFLLNGYAGTGKTSLCGALVRALRAVGIGAMLLAPTGRAAKVFASYSGHPAYTIHRRIYKHPGIGDMAPKGREVLENKYKDVIFIVDEASMITAQDGTGNVLEDLIHFVYTGENCKLLLMGDTAQLPPVGCDFSPAMDTDTLRSYGLRVSRATLTETARQAANSGILHNATWLRRAMRLNPLPLPKIFTDGYPDVRLVAAEEVPEDLYSAYNRDGIQETLVITRSNQRAAGFNREIRGNVLYLEEELAKGELILVTKNNYHWAEKIKEIDFIANGDVFAVERVHSVEEKYGFRFADVTLAIPDSEIGFEAKIMLESLSCEQAAIPQERMSQLYYAIMEDPELFSPYTPADFRLKALRSNPYWNALQVKYAYAVTCHKAQGGQWKNVFVDMSYIPPEAMGMEFYRWLYTAVSRATSRLYLIGFNQD